VNDHWEDSGHELKPASKQTAVMLAGGDEMAMVSPEELTYRLSVLKSNMAITQQFFKDVMIADFDYGTIPGTPRPSLLKAGAEKLLELYNYAACIKDVRETREPGGHYRALVFVQVLSRRTGATIAEGLGEANTRESRYMWRWIPDYKLPPGTSTEGLEYQTRKNQYGEYKVFRVENSDLYSLHNTVLKVAKKRAYVDAALAATRSSGIFTQDVEDLREWIENEKQQQDEKQEQRGQQQQAHRQQQQPPPQQKPPQQQRPPQQQPSPPQAPQAPQAPMRQPGEDDVPPPWENEQPQAPQAPRQQNGYRGSNPTGGATQKQRDTVLEMANKRPTVQLFDDFLAPLGLNTLEELTREQASSIITKLGQIPPF
jgi:hypothetical protein